MRPFLLLLTSGIVFTLAAQEFTRGIGVYPGDPKDDFGPVLRVDGTYRNLALHRPAYHSSAYDYNLTAQLVTDGIKDNRLPRWIAVSTSEGDLTKQEREWMVDNNPLTGPDLKGPQAWVQLEMGGGEAPLEVDRITVDARSRSRAAYSVSVSGSDDGRNWKDLGRVNGLNVHGPANEPSPNPVSFATPVRFRFYRATFNGADSGWHAGGFTFFRQGKQLGVGGPYDFTSAWKSAGSGQEWVKVDLGAVCTFDRVALAWIRRPAEGVLEVSDDGAQWTRVQALGTVDDFKLPKPAKGRWVRLSLTKPAAADGYVLSEFEVYGRGGPVPQPKPAPATHGRMELAGGAWRLQRDSLVQADGAALSMPGFQDAGWLPATVPGTVLTSYYNAGAVPDPNFGDNQLMISDSFFYADFWYRDEFVATPAEGRRVWLNFDGINWKADVFLNGEKIGRIEGGFRRGRFDVTGRLHGGQTNAIAVRVEKNATPGSVKEKTFQDPDKNGGALGADNPTFHASIGWDWIPTIRGRNTGIWNRVALTASGPVTIDDPFVNTVFPVGDTSQADVSVEATLRNHTATTVSGTLRGRFGDIAFDAPVVLAASGATTVKLDPSTHRALHLSHPKLWWPAGYGDANLYPVELKFETADGRESDVKVFQAGVRQFTYSAEGNRLRIWINGRRFVPRGGNWGFSESMLRYRAREYDVAVRYHRDMHFNMIRNWVGQIGENEFYDACDRHGIVVWQDFWLANPYDGPDPDNDAMFLDNSKDTVLRIRNHASIGLYVGRNEGFPPKALEDGLQRLVAGLHPGIHYIPSSADDVVSGHGPYQAMPPKYYFTDRATPMFHSEMGMPNIVTMDSLRLMMPESAMWPQGDLWGLHDFSLKGAQGGRSFRERIERSYGGAQNAADWVELAQFVNYEGYRGMFEGQSKHRMGLLIWMSHPCWPSFVWQTYDYYFDPTAAYFGAKKASEPLHIQWNPATDAIEVVNYSGGDMRALTAKVQLLNMDGTVQWEKSATVDSAEDSMVAPIRMEYPATLSAVHFLKLTLANAGDLVSENFYWRGAEEGNYRAIRDLPKVALTAETSVKRDGDRWLLTTRLENPARTPALMVHVKAVREKTGDRILPALYSDNYVALMPGEQRTIHTQVMHADTRGESPRVVVEGFNVK